MSNLKELFSPTPFDPQVIDDAFAQTIEWKPAHHGGSKYTSARLFQNDLGLWTFRRSKSSLFFIGGIFFFFFLVFIGPSLLAYLQGESVQVFLFSLFSFVLFGGIGFFLYYRKLIPAYTIDPMRKLIYKGKPSSSYDDVGYVALPEGISFDSVYALQILKERVSGKHSFWSYELNLVLKDTTRVCLVDHGSYKKLREDAGILSGVLGSPLWDTVELQGK